MNRTVVVSEIRHHIGSHRLGRKIVHGYIVTDAAERLIRVFQTTDGSVSERILSTASRILQIAMGSNGPHRRAGRLSGVNHYFPSATFRIPDGI